MMMSASTLSTRVRQALSSTALVLVGVPIAVGCTTTPRDAVDAGPATPGPDVVWYVLDETSGSVAKDSSANHFDVTLPGVTWDGGAVFDGRSVCGATTLGSAFRSPPLTLAAWLTPAMRTDQPTTVSLQPFPPNAVSGDIPGVGGYGVGLNIWQTGSALGAEAVSPCLGTGLCVANRSQNAAAAGNTGPSCTSVNDCHQGFVANKEYFIVVTVDQPAVTPGTAPAQVYVDGMLFDDDVAGIPAATAMSPLHVGCHNADTRYGTTRFFDGRMRDVRIYQRHMTAAEVRALYAGGPTVRAPRADRAVRD
jgi:hypothetical protein